VTAPNYQVTIPKTIAQLLCLRRSGKIAQIVAIVEAGV